MKLQHDVRRVRSTKTASYVLLLFMIAPLVSGCAFTVGLSQSQKSAVSNFGAATSAVSTTVSQELTAMRNQTIKMRIDELSAIQQVPEQWPDYQHLDRDFEPQTLQQRVAAAQVLVTYGNLLDKLATSSDSSDLNKAVSNFQVSVGDLAKKDISSDQLNAIGEAVRVVAGIYIERERLKALKTIVDNTHAEIDVVCGLLVSDFDPDGEHLMSGLSLAAGRLKSDADKALKKEGHSHRSDYGTLVRLYWEGSQNEDYAKNVGGSTVTVLKKIQTANNNLWQQLQNPEFAFTTPADIESDVKEIQAWSGILKN